MQKITMIYVLMFAFVMAPAGARARESDYYYSKTREELYIGGHLFFASEVEFGRRLLFLGKPCYLTFTWAHRSNGGLEEDNTAINPLYLSLAGKF